MFSVGHFLKIILIGISYGKTENISNIYRTTILGQSTIFLYCNSKKKNYKGVIYRYLK